MRSPDRNFGVVELLIVAVIIGVLMQLLLTAYLHQRVRGWEAAVLSDVRNVVHAESLFFMENERYAGIAALRDQGFGMSAQVDVWASESADARIVHVEAQHCRGGDRFRWRSDGGHTVERLARADRRC